MKSKYIMTFLPIIIGFAVFFILKPDSVSSNTWAYFSIFIAVVIGLIFEPLPAALIGIIGIIVAVLLKIGPVGSEDVDKTIKASAAIRWGLSGFSNSTVWLIFSAFMLGLGYDKSGLGKRISLLLVKLLGKTTLGLGYAVAIADGILAPFIPSNSARSGGTIFPIVSSIPPMMNSTPENGARKIGSYLMWVGIAATCVTSSMFFTALAPNLLAMETAKQGGFIGISWLGWFITFAPAGIILFLSTPLLTYYIYPPEIKRNDVAPTWASNELKKMGKMNNKEYLMLTVALLALIFWIGGDFFGIHSATVGISAIVLMVLFNIINWNDVLGNKSAWNVLIWFGSLVTLAGGLKNVGFLSYIADVAGHMLLNFNPTFASILLIIIFYLLHYFFASTTAHVTALLAIFMTLGAGIPNVNIHEITLLMMLSLGIMGIITPYGTGPSPVWYGSHYIKASEFWKLGFIFGIFYLVIFLIVTIPWLNIYANKFLVS